MSIALERYCLTIYFGNYGGGGVVSSDGLVRPWMDHLDEGCAEAGDLLGAV